ncbi:hypothetical protein [Streptomyces sp. ME19-01-6]|uniref:hypothetical protein n=1 Tax=Streptomyces sp. ME19-01-6 TaxID=3028686 RepID=UPI0029B34EE6|nr:hypothetical protein [Streptomyces sp. ME19-01-6]MDX3229386.1 hypothetical protein [Streptomyces sp. ME19-01-6]
MNPHRTAVETAKRILDNTETVDFRDVEAVAHAVGSLRGAVRGLLGVAEAQPKSARMRLQHDQEFLNLMSALRMETHALQGGVTRAARFADALLAMAEPTEDGGES